MQTCNVACSPLVKPRGLKIIPEVVIAISFGHIVWMLEKAGIALWMVTRKWEVVLSCALNIARWWWIEHHHRKLQDKDICFPGEVAMPQVMVLLALWSSMCGYEGDWQRGRYPSDYEMFEQFSFLGDQKGQAVFDMLQVYGTGSSLGPVWRPLWYRSNFVDWAKEVLKSPTVPDLYQHDLKKRNRWCGLDNISYPYVLVSETPGLGTLSEETGLWMRKESTAALPISDEFLIPKWGVHLRAENYGRVE